MKKSGPVRLFMLASWKVLVTICVLVLSLCYFLGINLSALKFKGQGVDKIGLIVLGGGVTKDGLLPEHVKLRLEHAIDRYKKYTAEDPKRGVYIITLSGGTPHKPNPTDSLGFPITEAKAGAKYLLDSGISAEHVLEEAFSLDTLGNAYFLRTMHIEPGRFNKLVIITNSWHMSRAREMFSHVFNLPSRPGGRGAIGRRWDLTYEQVAAGLDAETLAARERREKISLESFQRETRPAFSSMLELHNFLFNKHLAYASMRLLQKREKLDPKVLATY